MPTYSVAGPDGNTYSIEGPEGATREQVIGEVIRQLREQEREEASKQRQERLADIRESRRGSVSRGLDIGTDLIAQATGSSLEGIGSLLGLEGLEEYGAEVALENEADIQRKSRYQTRFDDIEGVGDFGSYLGGIAAESAPQMGAGLAGAAIGTGILPGLGTVVGGIAGATLANLPFFYGMNRERQKEAIDQGIKTEVDEGAAFLTALPQALLDGIVDKLLLGAGSGFGFTEKAIRSGGLFTRGAKGIGTGVITEAPTEVGQQMLERAQAGLSLDSDEAIAEYREAAIAGGLLGGAVSGTINVGRGRIQQEDTNVIDKDGEDATPIPRETAPVGAAGLGALVDTQTTDALSILAEEQGGLTDADVAEAREQLDTVSQVQTTDDALFDMLSGGIGAQLETGVEPEAATETAAETRGATKTTDVELTDDAIAKLLREEGEAEVRTEEEAGAALDAEIEEETRDATDTGDVVTEAEEQRIKERAKVGGVSVADMDESFQMEVITPSNYKDLPKKDQEYWDAEAERRGATDTVDDAAVERRKDLINEAISSVPALTQKTTDSDKAVSQTEKAVSKLTESPFIRQALTMKKLKESIEEAGLPELTTQESKEVRAQVVAAIKQEDAGKTPKVVTEKETTDVETETEVEAEPEDRLETIAEAVDTVKEETQEQIEAVSQVEEQAIEDAEKLIKTKGFSGRKAEDFTDEEVSTFATAIPALERSKMSMREKANYIEIISAGDQADFIAKEGREPTNEERSEIFNRAKKEVNAEQKLISTRLGKLKRATKPVQTKVEDRTAAVEAAKDEKPIRERLDTTTEVKEAEVGVLEAREEIEKGEVETFEKKIEKSKKTRTTSEREQEEIQKLNKAIDENWKQTQPEAYKAFVDSGKQKVDAPKLPPNLSDSEAVTELFFGEGKLTEQEQDALTYLTAHPTLERNLFDLAYDVAIDAPEYRASTGSSAAAKEFFAGKGGVHKDNALAWVRDNLSAEANMWVYNATESQIAKLERNPPLSADYYDVNQKASASPFGLEKSVNTPQVYDGYFNAAENKAKINLANNPEFLALLNTLPPKEQDRIKAEIKQDIEKAREAEKQSLALPKDSELNLDVPMHPIVMTQLRNGDLAGALRSLTTTSSNPRVKSIAKNLAKAVGETKLETSKNLKAKDGRAANGLFDPETNTIKLDADTGLNTHTVLHEMTHAATSAQLADGKSAAAKQLKKLFNEVKDQLGTAYGSLTVDEFVAEAFGNPTFQRELASITVPNTFKTAWHRFSTIVSNILNFLTGRPRIPLAGKGTTVDAFTDRLTTALLAPAPSSRFSGELLMDIKEGNAASAVRNYGRNVVEAVKNIDNKVLDEGATSLLGGAKKVAKVIGLAALNSQSLADVLTKTLGVKGAYKVHQLIENQAGLIDKENAILDGTAKQIEDFLKANPDKKDTFNQLIGKSTIEQVDPSKTKSEADAAYDSEKLAIWKGMQTDWNSLEAEGQAEYIRLRDSYKRLFDKLKEALAARFEVIEKENPNNEAVKELKNTLYQRLMEAATIEPYFPLTRTGEQWLRYTATPTDSNGNPTGPPEVTVEAFDTIDARTRRVRYLKTLTPQDDNASITQIGYFNNLNNVDFNNVAPTSFVSQMLQVLESAGVEKDVQLMIARNFIDAVPESSFLKSLHKRKGVAGYNVDAMDAYRQKAYSIARQAVNIKVTEELYSTRDDIRKALNKKLEDISTLRVELDNAERPADENRTPSQRAKEIAEIEKQIEELGANRYITEENVEAAVDELTARVLQATSPADNWVETAAKTANRLAFLGTIGFSAASTLVNTVQVPMVVIPFLAGKTNMSTAMSAARMGMNIFAGSGFNRKLPVVDSKNKEKDIEVKGMPSIDNYYTADNDGNLILRDDIEDVKNYYAMPIDDKGNTKMLSKKELLTILKPLITEAGDRSLLNRSLAADTLGVELAGKKRGTRLREAWDKFNLWSALPFHTAERMNRQVSLVASYLNEVARMNMNPNKAKGENNLTEQQIFETAIETALYDTQQTNGGATLATSPRIAQKHLGRVAMMFKTYGFTMYYHQLKMALTALQQAKENGLDDYTIRQARRQLVASLGTTAVMSGLQGLTLVGIFEGLANLFLDDEDEDAETYIRKFLGEPLYSGGLQYLTMFAGDVFGAETELDIASRIGLSHLILGNNKYDFNESAKEEFVNILGGPALSYGSSIARGVNDIYNGEMQRGIESIVPSAIRNVLKTFRYSDFDEGTARTRRGDPIVDDLNPAQMTAQFLGFAPAEYSRAQEINQDIKRIDRAVNQKRTKLMKKYYVAKRMGDADGIRETAEEIREFNKRHRNKGPKVRISTESLIRSMRMHAKTSSEMYNGITLSPNIREYSKELADEYARSGLF